MGMFDEYIPDGPNGLMVWRQGVAAPIDQSIPDEDVRLEPEQLARFRLPEQFTIYTRCCSGRFWVEALCYASGETWSRTELGTADTARQETWERRGDFKARLRWLRG